MNDRKKIIAAVAAGINAYMENQRQGSVFSALTGRRSPLTFSLWGVDGRQEMMQAKRMWQMRWIKK